MESLKTLSFEALTVPSPSSGHSVFLAACVKENLEELRSILSFSPSLLDTLITLETPALKRVGPEVADKTPADIMQEQDSPSHKAIQELFQQKAKGMENVNLIHMAARIGSVRHFRILASMGVDLDKTSPHRRDEFSTPLCLAAAYNKVDIIEELVSQGANIRKRNFRKFNAAHCAAEKGNTENLLYLLDKDFEMKNSLVSNRVNLLHLAARGGHTDMVEALINIGLDVNEEVDYDISDDEYEGESYTESFEDCVELDAEDLSDLDIFSGNATPLMLAAKSGNVKTLELLISKGATVQARDLHNRSALFYSCSGGNLLTTKFLIRNGLDVNCCDNFHSTLLHVITDVETTEMLVSEYELKVAACDAIKRTPLHYASLRGDVKVAKFLIQCGAQVNAVDQHGENPLITALFHHRHVEEEVISLLLKYGSSLDSGLYYSRASNYMAIISPGVARLIVELGNNVNAKVQGTTLLHLAAGSSFETVTFLVKSGADVNVRDDSGKLPLRIAAEAGQVEIIQFLLEQGSNVDYLDDSGSTPLLLAATNRNPEASLLLLKYSEK